MRYGMRNDSRRKGARRVLLAIFFVGVILAGTTVTARHVYLENLKPVSDSQQTTLVTVDEGLSAEAIAEQLKKAGLIRSTWAFKLYVSSKQVRDALQAGTYSLEPSQSTAEIVAQLTHGKVATDMVTIVPGQRLDQVKKNLIDDGFAAADVAAALDAANYVGNAALVDKPSGASLEGYLYPDTFEKTAKTSARSIVENSLSQMRGRLTPDLRAAFAAQGLSTYQAITLASVVENEVSKQTDRNQVAQVFLKRLRENIRLESDATASYGAVLDGKGALASYDSPYNTYKNLGLPPTPISNVTVSSLQAVAHPATTDWLYFVSGDDGVTRFSRTLAEHEANVEQYCHKLCGRE